MPTSAQQPDFTEFYEATWPRTVACAYAVTGDLGAAEEVAQDAYTSAWTRWSRIRDYDDPGSWVRRVAVRQAISRWRRARTALRHLVGQRDTEHHPAPDEDTLVLVDALRKLPDPQRRAVVLHHLADLPVAQVAEVERCPTGTVKARLARGRAALAELLGEPTDPPSADQTHQTGQEVPHA